MNLLRPFGWIYERVIEARNALYDRGVFNSYGLGARTISIGNITTGGTGKTPLVALVAQFLAEDGEKVCILTRGYGRSTSGRVVVSDGEKVLADARTGGDEPVELAYRLLGKAIVIADADRVAAAKFASDEFGTTAFVLDDGFQHRRAKRDLDIVCIDATDPLGNGHVLPAGRLREPINNLRRADAVVITRTDLVADISDIRSQILFLGSPIFTSRTRITGFIPIEELHARPQTSQIPDADPFSVLNRRKGRSGVDELRAGAFCGLGNPDAFFAQLKAAIASTQGAEIDLAATTAFPDHHVYSQRDISAMESETVPFDILITTAKDAFKLTGLNFEIPCFVAIAEAVVDDSETFRGLVLGS